MSTPGRYFVCGICATQFFVPEGVNPVCHGAAMSPLDEAPGGFVRILPSTDTEQAFHVIVGYLLQTRPVDRISLTGRKIQSIHLKDGTNMTVQDGHITKIDYGENNG